MNGLLLKDLLVLRAQAKIYGLLLGVYIILTLTGMFQTTFFSSMLVVILAMLPMSSFTLDEMARWDKFAATFPGGRNNIIKSKYLFLFIVLGAAVAAILIVDALVLVLHPGDADGMELLLSGFVSIAVGLLVNCLAYPFLFKYGSQKGRVIILILFAGMFGLFAAGVSIISFGGGFTNLFGALNPLPLLLVAAVVLLGILFASYRLSCKFYATKEL